MKWERDEATGLIMRSSSQPRVQRPRRCPRAIIGIMVGRIIYTLLMHGSMKVAGKTSEERIDHDTTLGSRCNYHLSQIQDSEPLYVPDSSRMSSTPCCVAPSLLVVLDGT